MKSLIEFIEAGLETICNDIEELWITVDGITITITTYEVCHEAYPFEASEILEHDMTHEAWLMLYESYIHEFMKLT